jgi:hypothetical protein
MSVTYIRAELRRLVVARSEGLCEYCLIAEEDTFYGCECDHIISEEMNRYPSAAARSRMRRAGTEPGG